MADKEIRVFISSTFNDMHPERDYLVKRTFPRLRHLAAKRGVTLTEVDLRWGITEAESKEGKTLAICLDEIINSRPFFIGLLGNRYGWIPSPDQLGDNAIPERYSWVMEDLSKGMSITELEMQFGVLRNPNDIHAYFYIRRGGMDDDVKQTKLKEAISSQHRYKADHYSDPEELGILVEANFKELLDTLYPEGNVGENDDQRTHHLGYARIEAFNYLPDPRIISKIEFFLSDDSTRQLLVTGDSGSGKSALLSHIVTQETERGVMYVVPYFASVGELPDAASLAAWIKGECDRASYGQQVLVVVDDAAAITDADSNPDISWLSDLPVNVKLIVSSADDQSVTTVLRREIPHTLSILPLLLSQHLQLAKQYFQSFRKRLTDEDYRLIVHPSKLFDNTLAYVTLLEELRCFGNFDKLPEYISHISSFETPDSFYNFILESKEKFYASERYPNTVRTIMSLLVLSAQGLTEADLVGISGIPQMLISQFLLGNTYLVKRHRGVLIPAHRRIAQVVTERYGLSAEEGSVHLREKIIDYFENEAVEEHLRDIELPYQYWKMDWLDDLYLYISDFNYLKRCMDSNRLVFLKYWQTLLEYDSWFYRVDAYFDAIPDMEAMDEDCNPQNILIDRFMPEIHVFSRSSVLLQFANLLIVFLDCDQPIEMLCTRALNTISLEETETREPWISTLASIYGRRGDFSKALQLFSEALDSLSHKDMDYVHTLLNNIAETYLTIGDSTHERRYYETAAKIQQEVLDYRIEVLGYLHKDVAVTMSNLASALFETGNTDEAHRLIEESTAIYRKLSGDIDIDVAINIANQCSASLEAGNYKESLRLSNSLIEILRQLAITNTPHLLQAYVYRLKALIGMGLKEDISETIAYCISLLQYISFDKDKIKTMITLIEAARHIDDGKSMQIILDTLLETDDLGNDAEAYNLRGKAFAELYSTESALSDYDTAISIYERTGRFRDAVQAAGAAAHFFTLHGEYDLAIQWFEKSLDLAERHAVSPDGSTGITWQNYAVTLFGQKRIEEAFQAMSKACEIRSSLFGADDPMLINEYLPLLEKMKEYSNQVVLTEEPCPSRHKDVERFASLIRKTEDEGESVEEYIVAYAKAHDCFSKRYISPAISLYKSLIIRLTANDAPVEAIAWTKRSLAYVYEIEGSLASLSSASQYYEAALEEAIQATDYELQEAIAHDYAEFRWNAGDFTDAIRLYTYQLEGAAKSVGLFAERTMGCIGNIGAALAKCGDDTDLQLTMHCGTLIMILGHAADNKEIEDWGSSLIGQALTGMEIDYSLYDPDLPNSIAEVMEFFLDNEYTAGAETIYSLYGVFGLRPYQHEDISGNEEDNVTLSIADTARRLYLEARLTFVLRHPGYMDAIVSAINYLNDYPENIHDTHDIDLLYGLLATASLECCNFDMAKTCYAMMEQLNPSMMDVFLKAASMTDDTGIIDEILDTFYDNPALEDCCSPLSLNLARITSGRHTDMEALEEMDITDMPVKDFTYLLTALLRAGVNDKATQQFRTIAGMKYEDPLEELQRVFALCSFLKESGLQEEVEMYQTHVSQLLDKLGGYEEHLFTAAFQSLSNHSV